MVSVDVKHHVYLLPYLLTRIILCPTPLPIIYRGTKSLNNIVPHPSPHYISRNKVIK